jgi:hypothetical protein
MAVAEEYSNPTKEQPILDFSKRFDLDETASDERIAEARAHHIRSDSSVEVAYAYIASILCVVTETVTYRKLMSALALLFMKPHDELNQLNISMKPAANSGFSPLIKQWYLYTVMKALEPSKYAFVRLKAVGDKIKVIITPHLEDYARDHYNDTFGDMLRAQTIRDFQSELRIILKGSEQEIIQVITDELGLSEAIKDIVVRISKCWRTYTSLSTDYETKEKAKCDLLEYVDRLINWLGISKNGANFTPYCEGSLIALSFRCAIGLFFPDRSACRTNYLSIERLREECKSYPSLVTQIDDTLAIIEAAENTDSEALSKFSKRSTSEWSKILAEGFLQLCKAHRTGTNSASVSVLNSLQRMDEGPKPAAPEHTKNDFRRISYRFAFKLLTERAWERWSILITMFDVAIEKATKGSIEDVIIRAWEVKGRGNHEYSAVYDAYDLLSYNGVVISVEHDADPHEVKFSEKGLPLLEHEIECWKKLIEGKRCSSLEAARVKMLNERLEQFKRLRNSAVAKAA